MRLLLPVCLYQGFEYNVGYTDGVHAKEHVWILSPVYSILARSRIQTARVISVSHHMLEKVLSHDCRMQVGGEGRIYRHPTSPHWWDRLSAAAQFCFRWWINLFLTVFFFFFDIYSPVQSTSVHSSPLQSSPVQSVQSSPVQSTSVQWFVVSRSQTLAGRESLVNCPYKTCSNTHPNWGGR